MLRFKFDMTLPPGFSKAKRDPRVKEWMIDVENEILRKALAFMKAGTPKVTGKAKAGWTIVRAKQKKRVVHGSIFNRTYGAFGLEYRIKPHFPPVNYVKRQTRVGKKKELVPLEEPALGPWIRRKLGITDRRKIIQVAFLISRAFAAYGMPTRILQGQTAPSAGLSATGRVYSWAHFTKIWETKVRPWTEAGAKRRMKQLARIWKGQ